MYKKMLVLLDGSKLAEVVFTYAQELAGRLNLSLELLQVVDPKDEDQLPMRQAYMEHMAEILQNKADEIRSKSGLRAKNEPARGSIVVGYPAEEILKYIDANKVDLLMLSTHGNSGIKRWNIGSVASQVIHAARIPIWIVPSELNEAAIYDKMPRRTIVVPLNRDQETEGVIPYAISIAKQRGAESEIVLLYVDKISVAKNSIQLKRINKEREATQKYLDDIAKRIKDSGITVRTEILIGEDHAYQIINYIKDNPPQLMAMAAPRSGLSKMVYGSVTEDILQLIKKTPLLLIPR